MSKELKRAVERYQQVLQNFNPKRDGELIRITEAKIIIANAYLKSQRVKRIEGNLEKYCILTTKRDITGRQV